MQERRYRRVFILIPFLIVGYFVLQIFLPFLLPMALAATFASLCYPVYSWIDRRLGGRRNLSALLTCLGFTLLVMGPFVLLLLALVAEVSEVYGQFQTMRQQGELERLLDWGTSPYLGPLLEWLEGFVDLDKVDLVGGLTAGISQISLFFLRHATQILTGAIELVLGFVIMLVTMFFLFRDGERLVQELTTWTPLSEDDERLIMDKFRQVASATVVGSLSIAVVQGMAGGILFWAVGISNVVLWGALMGLLALLPAVGPALVWGPWAIYFLSTGSIVKGVALIVFGALVVGMLDNVLRPLLIEGRARMHTMLVFLSILGGIIYFGMAGMIFGPILVALGLTFLELYKAEFHQELAKPARGGPARKGPETPGTPPARTDEGLTGEGGSGRVDRS